MNEEFAVAYGGFERWHWWFLGRNAIVGTAIRRLTGGPVARVLSVGCGPAAGLAWLQPFVSERGKLLGLDVEYGHGAELPHGVAFAVGALPHAPLAAATFDLVLALDVLEHVDDDAAALQEIARLVRPGGALVITVPALPSLWGRQDVVSHHRRRYRRRPFERLLAGAGLRGARVTYCNTILFPLIAAARWSRRLLGRDDASRSDFEDNRPGIVNTALHHLFAAERHFIGRLPLPIGVTLLAMWRRPAG